MPKVGPSLGVDRPPLGRRAGTQAGPDPFHELLQLRRDLEVPAGRRSLDSTRNSSGCPPRQLVAGEPVCVARCSENAWRVRFGVTKLAETVSAIFLAIA